MNNLDKFNLFFFIVLFFGLFILDFKVLGINFTTFLIVIPIFVNLNKNIINLFKNHFYFKFFTLFYFSYGIILILVHNIDFINLVKSVSPYLYSFFPLIIFKSFSNPVFQRRVALFLKIVFLVFLLFFFATYDANNEGVLEVFKFTHRTVLGYFFIYLFVFIYLIEKKRLVRILFLISILVEMVVNSSRGPFIIILLFIFYNFKLQYGYKVIPYLVLVGLFISLSYGYISPDSYLGNMSKRVSTIFDTQQESSSNYRLSVFNASILYGMNNPFGGGYESFSNEFDNYSILDLTYAEDYKTDNTFAKIIFEVGFIPIFFLIGFIFSLLRSKNNIMAFLSIMIAVNFLLDDSLNSLLFMSFTVLSLGKQITSKNK
jgi:hypothetical protein